MRFFPRTLLWRTFALIAPLMLLSVLAWYRIYVYFDREPRAQQAAQMVVSVVNLTRAALVNADSRSRRDLLIELSDREGIRVYPVEKDDRVTALVDSPLMRLVTANIAAELGSQTRFASAVDEDPGFWVSFRIDDDDYWMALPADRLERHFPAEWIGWGFAALGLSLAGAYLIVFRLTRPLKALSAAARAVGRGGTPATLEETGPTELATVARAFNRMSGNLAQLDSDRALILAGISHDLRTPLARLRLGIELSGADQTTRDEMNLDIDEMDRIIGQFLEFARHDEAVSGGESFAQLDSRALIEEVIEPYRKRGVAISADLPATPQLAGRPNALRRALTNLIDNALRYAGAESPIDVETSLDAGCLAIAVKDRGPGIPPEEVERLKRPFTRLESARSNAKGSGLGLAIVERIARGHGGELRLLPREGGGLTAQILLPLAEKRS